jgi:hypothetical protein
MGSVRLISSPGSNGFAAALRVVSPLCCVAAAAAAAGGGGCCVCGWSEDLALGLLLISMHDRDEHNFRGCLPCWVDN